MVALTAEQLMAWVDTTSEHWKTLLTEHPEALHFPCDVIAAGDVAGLVQHIVAVELRYAQRLAGVAETSYNEIAKGSADELYATHARAMELLRAELAAPHADWEETIAFATRSRGTLQARRRVVLVHALMHSIRHYAQLATLVRQRGVTPGWPMDYLFMESEPA